MAGRQKRSEQTVERLVAAAADAFARHGYTGATLADISRHAGVTKGALFFHFSTKDEIAVAVLERARETMERAALRLEAAGGPFLQIIVDLTYVLGRLLREDVYVRASVRIARERDDAGPQGHDDDPPDFYRQWLGRLGGLLDQARRVGELDGSVSQASARTPVTAAVTGLETLTWLGAPAAQCDTWLADLWELTLTGLASREGLRGVRTTPPGHGGT
ncbi:MULTISPECIES: ScbR family autoregulator-binding transcription factor [unclassified Streptomyces]|uniref:ScbR family autoregulator-binding transcription factor n=1 Tax=unclassified Streptomyces TaxID=2593676 RepID=UPI001F03C8D4|nr:MULTISPECIES: ScbR family autoregulator-binding transcription factor [unclassified Streptomyces]MCH0562244.1 TetR/AcrR family transcriptional regulator [Streptomyces sp. MUM 2J]MCH0573104.1 TetR/AcrR family transcriptional regulator [Streptomyces sp. MUM 136J]